MQILTRLNPKTVNFDSIGGIAELTTADIAAALAGGNAAGVYLLIYTICDAGDFDDLCELFDPLAKKLAKRMKWRHRKIDHYEKFLRLMLAEYTSNKKCPSCRGTKFSKIDPSKECKTCRGTGIYVLMDKEKANFMKISKAAYCKSWVEKEKEIKSLFDRKAYQAKQSFYSKMYEKVD